MHHDVKYQDDQTSLSNHPLTCKYFIFKKSRRLTLSCIFWSISMVYLISQIAMIYHNLVNMGKCFHTTVGCPNGTFASHVLLVLIQYIYISLKGNQGRFLGNPFAVPLTWPPYSQICKIGLVHIFLAQTFLFHRRKSMLI